jgi:hypothetical protein
MGVSGHGLLHAPSTPTSCRESVRCPHHDTNRSPAPSRSALKGSELDARDAEPHRENVTNRPSEEGDALGREQWIFINRKSPVNVQQLVMIEAI